MIFTGGIWYYTQWWFVLTILITDLAIQTVLWLYANHKLKAEDFKWRYKFSLYNHLCFFAEHSGIDFYWLEKPTSKDWFQLRKRQNKAQEAKFMARNAFR